MISTQIEREFIGAIERQQRLVAARGPLQTRGGQHQRRHWLSVLYAGWWPSRAA